MLQPDEECHGLLYVFIVKLETRKRYLSDIGLEPHQLVKEGFAKT